MISFWNFGFIYPREKDYSFNKSKYTYYTYDNVRPVEPVEESPEKNKETKERHFSDYRIHKTPIEIYKDIQSL